MYQVKRNKTLPKLFKEATFQSYEQARSKTRAWIRANYECEPGENMPIASAGFRIEKIEQATA